ncbi:MAG: hypothetical protein KAK00_03430 [Nanoarchaeota archaeon]|nr:hypothetical protein [Nanoarchaeota archaeon]
MRNGVNYNDLFDETAAKYLTKAFLKKAFTAKDMGFYPRTFSRVSALLEGNEFQHTHPFFDGNNGTTRLIAFHFLQMNDIPVFDIPLGLLEEYVFSTKGAKKRNDYKLGQILQQIILYNLKTINGNYLKFLVKIKG